MRTLINKTLLASASALSVLGLLLIMPLAVSAQELETEIRKANDALCRRMFSAPDDHVGSEKVGSRAKNEDSTESARFNQTV